MLYSGLSWLATTLVAHAARPVVYRRGGLSTTISAIVGRRQPRVEAIAGDVRVETSERDYLVRAADLRLAGVQVQPARGDYILDNNERWELTGTGESPGWETSDPYGVLLRISTRRVPS